MEKLKNIFFAILGFGLMLIVLELFFTLGGITNPIIRIDSKYGEQYIPDKMCNSLFVTEGFGLAKTNENGWFGKGQPKINSSEKTIGVIGNSFVASRQVFSRNNFLNISEIHLNRDSESTYGVYNYGKEALPLSQLLHVKEIVKEEYNPDHILILINDRSFKAASRMAPFYELDNKEQFVLNTDFKSTIVYKVYQKVSWLSNSSILFLAYRVKNFLPNTGRIIFDKFYPDKEVILVNTQEKEQLSTVNSKILHTLVADKDIVFITDIRGVLAADVKEILKDANTIDLRPFLEEMETIDGVNPYYWEIDKDYGHWNNEAHKKIGLELAKKLPHFFKR
ncbi:hypothetical protein [uncultured Maribacter sp.]|uniref:hypothetical protein n=1 Tax=uncultured Maribacter sp. TaxID=431308 RepID=UPI0026251005|nr:hypothetical protein [uncultured Maribacter sp.]